MWRKKDLQRKGGTSILSDDASCGVAIVQRYNFFWVSFKFSVYVCVRVKGHSIVGGFMTAMKFL